MRFFLFLQRRAKSMAQNMFQGAKEKIALNIISKIASKKDSEKSIRIVPSQVWEDEKGVDAAVLASAQHVSSFDTIPGLSLASRLVWGHKLSGPSN